MQKAHYVDPRAFQPYEQEMVNNFTHIFSYYIMLEKAQGGK